MVVTAFQLDYVRVSQFQRVAIRSPSQPFSKGQLKSHSVKLFQNRRPPQMLLQHSTATSRWDSSKRKKNTHCNSIGSTAAAAIEWQLHSYELEKRDWLQVGFVLMLPVACCLLRGTAGRWWWPFNVTTTTTTTTSRINNLRGGTQRSREWFDPY